MTWRDLPRGDKATPMAVRYAMSVPPPVARPLTLAERQASARRDGLRRRVRRSYRWGIADYLAIGGWVAVAWFLLSLRMGWIVPWA